VDTKKPSRYEKAKMCSLHTAKEKFDEMEHVRRLHAMTKRMESLGKVS